MVQKYKYTNESNKKSFEAFEAAMEKYYHKIVPLDTVYEEFNRLFIRINEALRRYGYSNKLYALLSEILSQTRK